MGVSCSKDTGVITNPTTQPQQGATDESTGDFLPFSRLNDDVILCILSYVSYTPFERDPSGTMTLATRHIMPRDEETERLLQDYNAGATKLNKKVLKRRSNISPFLSPQQYYHEAFHSESLSPINSTRMFGTLTHVLPLVNKRFRLLCNQSDILWTESLERLLGLRSTQVRSDMGSSDLWEAGLLSFIKCNDPSDNDSPGEGCANGSGDDSRPFDNARVRSLIIKACDCINKEEDEPQEQSSLAGEVFRQVLLHHKPVRLPVFSMFCPITIGEELSLRLFEPRYRLMIAEVMSGRSDRERQGFPISTPRPRFLFACRSDSFRRAVTCIVEVRRCLIRQDGIADVEIVPISWAILEKRARRPESGGLVDGTLVRSPKRTRMPAFCMRTHLILQQPLRIRLYEERYRTMISEVMAGRSDEERSGSPIAEPRPQFVFVCNNRFKEGDVACLVDIESCRIHSDGSAQVTVVPTSRVLVYEFRKRPKSGNLYDASILYPLAPLSEE